MMILQKNRGISSFMEICDVKLSGNYEEKMIINNELQFVPHTELREVDGDRSLYVKIDGLCTLASHYGRLQPCKADVEVLVSDIRDCLKEIKEYLLNPEGLVLDINYILYSDHDKKHEFMYVPGYRKSFRDQIKSLFEDIMRIYDHGDRNGVVYLYDTYSRFLGENFTPELFCKIIGDGEEERGKSFDKAAGVPVERSAVERKREHVLLIEKQEDAEPGQKIEEADIQNDKENKKEKLDKSIYILAGIAAAVVAVVMYIFFGVSSFKFSGITFVLLAVYVLVDILNRRQEQDVDDSMRESLEIRERRRSKQDGNKKTEKDNLEKMIDKSTKMSTEKTLEVPSEALSGHNETPAQIETKNRHDSTTVLVDESGTKIVSRLVPCDEEGEQIYLIEGETRIGRLDGACDYCIDDSSISRIHAIIEKHGTEVGLKDAGSTNGTYINDSKLLVDKLSTLNYGDMVSFANIRYECL